MTVQDYNNSVEQYSDSVFRFVLKLTKSQSDADDLVQVSYEKLWLRYETVDYTKVKSWLFTTAYRAFIDNKRRARTDYVEIFPDSVEANTSSQFELKEILNKALDMIPEIQKSCILLRDYEGYAYDEIGDILNLSEAQVKVYIFRARTKMKQILTENFKLS